MQARRFLCVAATLLALVVALSFGAATTTKTKKTTTKSEPTDTNTGEGIEFCVACTFLVTSAEEGLAANKTVSEVSDLLDDLCGLLPTADRFLCQSVVPLIVGALDGIGTDLPPHSLCEDLHLCGPYETYTYETRTTGATTTLTDPTLSHPLAARRAAFFDNVRQADPTSHHLVFETRLAQGGEGEPALHFNRKRQGMSYLTTVVSDDFPSIVFYRFEYTSSGDRWIDWAERRTGGESPAEVLACRRSELSGRLTRMDPRASKVPVREPARECLRGEAPLVDNDEDVKRALGSVFNALDAALEALHTN